MYFPLIPLFSGTGSNFSITSGKDDLFRPFVIPAKAGIQADFEPLLDSGFHRNDVMNPNFLRNYDQDTTKKRNI